MALADPIFTLVVGFQLFWAAFDLLMTVVPLKVALGLEKIYFWAFKKNNHDDSLDIHLHDYFFEMPKNQFFPILKQLLRVPLSWTDQKLSKTIEPSPSNVNIECVTAICLKKSFL